MRLAATGDVRVMRFGMPRGGPRLARHLWRMCFALFIAAGSFFSIRARVAYILPEPSRPHRCACCRSCCCSARCSTGCGGSATAVHCQCSSDTIDGRERTRGVMTSREASRLLPDDFVVAPPCSFANHPARRRLERPSVSGERHRRRAGRVPAHDGSRHRSRRARPSPLRACPSLLKSGKGRSTPSRRPESQPRPGNRNCALPPPGIRSTGPSTNRRRNSARRSCRCCSRCCSDARISAPPYRVADAVASVAG